jgi:hypothetical protein
VIHGVRDGVARVEGARQCAAGETLDVGDGVVVEGLLNSVMFVDGWLGLVDGRWKTALVAAYGEDGGGVG